MILVRSGVSGIGHRNCSFKELRFVTTLERKAKGVGLGGGEDLEDENAVTNVGGCRTGSAVKLPVHRLLL